VKPFSIILIGLLLHSTSSFSRDLGNIIQVQRKIRMSDAEPISPKEYFVDMGSRDGLKEGESLEVYRSIPVINGQGGGPWHLMRVKIGDLRVAHVGETSALAREEQGRNIASLPPMEYQTFMLGDEVMRRTVLQPEAAQP